jgi:hypothetical protein
MVVQGFWHFVNGKRVHPRTLVAKYGTINEDKLRRMAVSYDKVEMLNKHRYIKLLGSHKENKEVLASLKHPVLPFPKVAEEVSGVTRLISSQDRGVRFPHSANCRLDRFLK